MLGGTDDPCIPEKQLKLWQEKFDQECPRVDLDDRNLELMNVALFILDRFLHPGFVSTIAETILPAYMEDYAATRPKGKVRKELIRLRGALLSEEVVEALEYRMDALEKSRTEGK